jgi:DNA-binding transcriptional regulator GbsR (MarR family)
MDKRTEEFKNLLTQLLNEGAISQEDYDKYVKLLDNGQFIEAYNGLKDQLETRLTEIDLEIVDASIKLGDEILNVANEANDEELKQIADEYYKEIHSALADYNKELDKINYWYSSLQPEIKELEKIIEEKS